jgi:toxin ParE1/3/4
MSEASEAPWRVVFAADAVNDLLLISAHLMQAYQGFGEPLEEASRHAAARIDIIINAAPAA